MEYLQFAFRWMNNLLMREIPLRCIIRLWDTCLVSVQVYHTPLGHLSGECTGVMSAVGVCVYRCVCTGVCVKVCVRVYV